MELKSRAYNVLEDLRSLDGRIVVALVAVTALLSVRQFFFNAGFFHANVSALLPRSEISYMYADMWWGAGVIALYFCVAAAIGRFVLGVKLRDMGVSLKNWKINLLAAGGLWLVMLPFVIVVSGDPAFRNQYPFPGPQTGVNALHFLLWESVYGVQFFALEFLFRGFMLFILWDKLRYNAIFVMMIPYTMIHFMKPAPEAFGSIIAGFALGYLALKTRSMLGCFALHFAVALSMDVTVLLKNDNFFLY